MRAEMTGVAIEEHGRGRQVLLCAVAAAIATLAIVGLSRQAPAGIASRVAPAGLSPEQSAVSRLLGADQRSFWAVSTGGAVTQRNAQEGLTVTYPRSGPMIHSRRGTVGIGLSLLARGAGVQAAQASAPLALRNRVSYTRGGGVVEWYANGPYGLEQGVTVASRPLARDAGRLRLVFALRGSLAAQLHHGVVTFGRRGASKPLLRYLGLSVTDARGRTLPARLSLAGSRLTIRVDDARAQYPITVDPTVASVNLTESNGSMTDRFGSSIAQSASGSLVVVGAPGADDGEGAAYVFAKPSAGWAAATQTTELTDPDAVSAFGLSVAVVGTSIAVGAPYAGVDPNADTGFVDVYSQPASGWSNPGTPVELADPDGESGDTFGSALAASGNQLFVGAPGVGDPDADTRYGVVYEYNQPTGGFQAGATETAELTADGSGGLGTSLAADGSTVVAGAPYTSTATTDGGAAYVFSEPAAGWGGTSPQPAELTASDGTQYASLASEVAINAASGTIVAAAREQGADYGGAVYVFQESAGGWASETQTAELTQPTAPDVYTAFGNAIAITNGTGSGPPTPPAGKTTKAAANSTPTSAGWSIGVVASDGAGGLWLFPASGGSWADRAGGTAVTLGILDASPYSLSVEPAGIAVGQWMGSVDDDIATGSAYEFPNTYKVSGKVVMKCAGATLCGKPVAVAGQTIEISGTEPETAITNKKGEFSAVLPGGQYTLEPTPEDNVTYTPAKLNVGVSSTVTDADFEGCASSGVKLSRDRASVASAGRITANFGSCFNGFAIHWVPGEAKLKLSWRFKSVCTVFGVDTPTMDPHVKVMQPLKNETIETKSHSMKGAVADVYGFDHELMLNVVINSRGQAAVKVHNGSRQVRFKHENNLTPNSGEREECFPKEEEVATK